MKINLDIYERYSMWLKNADCRNYAAFSIDKKALIICYYKDTIEIYADNYHRRPYPIMLQREVIFQS